MAGESKIAVTEGAGKNVHTWQRSINAVNVEEDVAILGEPYLATYTAIASSITTATSASHLMQIMAGASLNVRIKKVTISQLGLPAAVSIIELMLIRLTTAGTGGTVITPGKYDNGDAAAGATAMTLPTVLGTLGTAVWQETMTCGTAAIPSIRNELVWTQLPHSKPIIIPAGAANGLAIRIVTGLAAATVDISVEFTESSFVL